MKKFLLLLAILPTIAFSQDYPEHRSDSYINDFADVIADEDEPMLDRKIRKFKDQTSIEMTVVTVESLGGEDVADYTNELFRKWGVGKKGLDNGLMILLAPNERKWRIEVGYGLEEWLTDGYTKDKGDALMTPNFKNNDYFRGFELILDDFITKLGPNSWEQREAYKAQQKKEASEAAAAFFNFLMWSLIVVAICVFLFFIFRREVIKQREKKEEEERKARTINSLKYQNDSTISSFKAKMQQIEQIKNPDAEKAFKEMKETLVRLNDVISQRKMTEDSLMSESTLLRTTGARALGLADQVINDHKKMQSIKEFVNTASTDLLKINTSAKEASARNIKSPYVLKGWSSKNVDNHLNEAEKNLNEMSQLIKSDNSLMSQAVLVNKLTNLESLVHSSLVGARSIIESLNKHIDSMEHAVTYLSKNRGSVKSLVIDAQRKINQTDVSTSTKNKFVSVKSKAEKFSESEDIMQSYTSLSSIISDLNSVISMADSDVRRKKREREEEEEEKKRKKRREEERKRRNNDDNNSFGGFGFGSGGGSSSSSCGSSSFGGGDSGGGGSSGDY